MFVQELQDAEFIPASHLVGPKPLQQPAPEGNSDAADVPAESPACVPSLDLQVNTKAFYSFRTQFM